MDNLSLLLKKNICKVRFAILEVLNEFNLVDKVKYEVMSKALKEGMTSLYFDKLIEWKDLTIDNLFESLDKELLNRMMEYSQTVPDITEISLNIPNEVMLMTVAHIIIERDLKQKLIPEVNRAVHILRAIEKQKAYLKTVSIDDKGYVDVVNLSNVLSSYRVGLESFLESLEDSMRFLRQLPLGSLSSGKLDESMHEYLSSITSKINELENDKFVSDNNKMYGMTQKNSFVINHSNLCMLASSLFRMSSDIYLRTKNGEINFSMPMLNLELLQSACIKVQSNQYAINTSCSVGVTSMQPFVISILSIFLESIDILNSSFEEFINMYISKFNFNEENLKKLVLNSNLVNDELIHKYGDRLTNKIKELAILRDISIKEAIEILQSNSNDLDID